MKTYFCSALLLLSFAVISCTSEPQTFDDVTSEIESMLEAEEGTFAVAFQDLNNPERTFLYNADERFHAASTMKTPVMIEIFKRVEAGEFSIHDSVTIINEFSSIMDGSPYSIDIQEDSRDPIEHMVGEQATIFDLTHAMITYSSNIGTNILIDMVGAENVTQSMRELEADSIEVRRGLYDMKAFDEGVNNTTTARDLLTIFERLAAGDLLSRSSNEMMVDILLDQEYRDVIPRNLPDEVMVANKTGSISGVEHDSGIVYLQDGRTYALIFLSKDLPDDERGREIGGSVSELIYNYYIAN